MNPVRAGSLLMTFTPASAGTIISGFLDHEFIIIHLSVASLADQVDILDPALVQFIQERSHQKLTNAVSRLRKKILEKEKLLGRANEEKEKAESEAAVARVAQGVSLKAAIDGGDKAVKAALAEAVRERDELRTEVVTLREELERVTNAFDTLHVDLGQAQHDLDAATANAKTAGKIARSHHLQRAVSHSTSPRPSQPLPPPFEPSVVTKKDWADDFLSDESAQAPVFPSKRKHKKKKRKVESKGEGSGRGDQHREKPPGVIEGKKHILP